MCVFLIMKTYYFGFSKAPMYASLPHFLDSDPNLLKHVKGLSPDANEHGIEIDFEPVRLKTSSKLNCS